jgi:hypothetical protein
MGAPVGVVIMTFHPWLFMDVASSFSFGSGFFNQLKCQANADSELTPPGPTYIRCSQKEYFSGDITMKGRSA